MKSHRKELFFEIPARRGFVNITPQVEDVLAESGGKSVFEETGGEHAVGGVEGTLPRGHLDVIKAEPVVPGLDEAQLLKNLALSFCDTSGRNLMVIVSGMSRNVC